MKIVVLQGSPNKEESTDILVREFTRGAQEGGHSVTRFDLADMNISPCTGCVTCGYEGPCILQDDNQKIRTAILGAVLRPWPGIPHIRKWRTNLGRSCKKTKEADANYK